MATHHRAARPPTRPAGLLVAALLVLLAACAPGYDATVVPDPPAPPTSPGGGGSTSTPAPCEDPDPLRSYDPPRENPRPGDMPSGSTMARIAERGRVVAGVSADTYLMGSRNPATGQIEGYDIDLVKAMAEAILGDEDAYELRVITAQQRIELLQEGEVDMVARNMTINCQRWQDIAFSAEYYRSGQKVLVRRGSSIDTVADLAGRRVCAPESTSSIELLRRELPEAEAVGAANHTGCLILFQGGQVDAITGDDTVLAGLVVQDPYARVLEMEPLSAEPYGIGFNAEQTDLVAFANRVLADRIADGEWEASYDRWLRRSLGPAPEPPRQVYGR
ncbi:glutamate ABC transporter substrate-binding protein [Auraticoccus monumenti]|uniref:Amino acid ABC transporter substrate-binding protein, PAAT family n=1 Tax=Auraticoccus monumenti TaxID=675864 RepID=A0A1G7AIU9_9ACTN|nr:glutamate ABC transporter substrate-binding protein [Auraticoccus monumenti]SDE14663.1 amino acid ABC transporter substrate-binding protein, PAAT family [Auraticoccus monumenti]